MTDVAEPERTTPDQQHVALIERFARSLKLRARFEGECGIMRPCVGLLQTSRDAWVDYSPRRHVDYNHNAPLPPDFDPFPLVFPDDPPFPRVEDAHHKHDCVAVLVHGNDYAAAAGKLAAWCHAIEWCEPFVEDYATGAVGLQALLTGSVAQAIRTKKTWVPQERREVRFRRGPVR